VTSSCRALTIVTSKGLAADSVYRATKAAARSFARTWTTELRAQADGLTTWGLKPRITPAPE
jgi:hypothetical protein